MEPDQRHRHRRNVIRAVLGVLPAIVLAVGLMYTRTPPRQVQLADGRILQIEAVTFGTNHQVGSDINIFRFLAVLLPSKLSSSLPMARPASRFQLGHPILMVWVNALDPTTGKYVNNHQVRMEIVDDQGSLYGGVRYSSMSDSSFSRSGYAFEAFPRTLPELTLQISPLDTNQSVRIQIPNPHRVTPAVWSGGPLPQTKTVGNMEVGITGLVLRTNTVRADGRGVLGQHWEPVWELRESGQAATGWDPPEWDAEDPTGNRSHFLGVHEPILRFDAKFWPNATNTEAAVLIGASPPVALDTLQSNIWWNQEILYHTGKVALLGLFPPGTHVFSEGAYVTNLDAGVETDFEPSQRSSHWEISMTKTGPGKVLSSSSHSTPVPTVYLRAPGFGAEARLAVRVRDELGRYWTTKADLHDPNRERAYPVRVPSTVKTVVAEIVVLKPVQAEFFVRTGSGKEL